jgi:P27 family predicted phage terminase small subunit
LVPRFAGEPIRVLARFLRALVRANEGDRMRRYTSVLGTGELSKLNMITNLDRGALATYCGAYAMWAEAMEQIQKYGTMVKSPSGFPIQSPYLAIANRQAEIMMRIASEFGFTPASRSRISAPPLDQLPLFGAAEQED